MVALDSARLRTTTDLIAHATGKFELAATLFDETRKGAGRVEAAGTAMGALHEVRLALEHASAAGLEVGPARAAVDSANEVLLEHLPDWVGSGKSMKSIAWGPTAPSARIDQATAALASLRRAADTERMVAAAVADTSPLTREEFSRELTGLVRNVRHAPSSTSHRPVPLELRALLKRASDHDVMLTARGRTALTDARDGLTTYSAREGRRGVEIPTTPEARRAIVRLRDLERIERTSAGAIAEARETFDTTVASHVAIMRGGEDLTSAPTKVELVEMTAAHAAAAADSIASLVETGRYLLIGSRLQRFADPAVATRHAYDAAVHATRASLAADRLARAGADDAVAGALRTHVHRLADRTYDNADVVARANARGLVRQHALAMNVRPSTLEDTTLSETIANLAAQVQARDGEPLHRLDAYEEAFENMGSLTRGGDS